MADAVAAELPRDAAADDGGDGVLLDRADAEPGGGEVGQPAAGGSAAVADREHAVAGVLHSARDQWCGTTTTCGSSTSCSRGCGNCGRDVETQPQQQQQQPSNQQQQKPGGKNGSATAAPERGGVLNASGQGTGYRVQGAEGRSAFSVQRSEQQEAAEAGVLVGTGRLISLGESETGLQEAVEAAGYVEGSLV